MLLGSLDEVGALKRQMRTIYEHEVDSSKTSHIARREISTVLKGDLCLTDRLVCMQHRSMASTGKSSPRCRST